MTINEDVRKKATEVLKNVNSHTDTEVHNAVIDLRRNPKRGDEVLLVPLLEHHDAMVAAAALYALTHIYGNPENYRDLIMKLSQGDPRDYVEMPLQSEALEDLAELASHGDQEALELLWKVAESPSTNVSAELTAWSCLARLAGEEWSLREFDKYAEIMIGDPESQEAEQIRQRVREAAKRKGIYIQVRKTD